MQVKNPDAFTKFIKQTLGQGFDYESVWLWAEREFGLNQSREFEISMSSCTQAYEAIKKKVHIRGCRYISSLIQNWPDDWHKNQRKLFLQILFCFCFSKNTHPLKMGSEDWQFMSSLMFEKNPLFLKFQAYEHLKLQRRLQWGVQDDLIIEECVTYIIRQFSKCGEGSWNQISKLIFYQTNCTKFFSTKQIRERWNNHIRKGLKKGSWSNEEDIALLEHVLHNNRRWSEITRVFQKTRTQHMIKNRYNFLTVKHQRHELKKPEKILRLLDKIKQKDNLQKSRVSARRHQNNIRKQEQKQNHPKITGQDHKQNSQQEKKQVKNDQLDNLPQPECNLPPVINPHPQPFEPSNNTRFPEPSPIFFSMPNNLYNNFNPYQQNGSVPIVWVPMGNCQISYSFGSYNQTFVPQINLASSATTPQKTNDVSNRIK